jgi:hypothetical protein
VSDFATAERIPSDATDAPAIDRHSDGLSAPADAAPHAPANNGRQRSNGKPHSYPPLAAEPQPLEEMPLWNYYYLNLCRPQRDPTIVWGTEVDCSGLQSFLKDLNSHSSTLVTPAHVLVAATGRALRQHPHFNRRILKRRIWSYKDVNIVMPFRPKSGLDVMFFANVDRKSIADIATESWRNAHGAADSDEGVPHPIYMRFPRRLQGLLQPFHVWLVNRVNLNARSSNTRQRAASTMVNYFGHRGMAPLRSFKPSRLPYESISLTVTMGAIEQRPVAMRGQVVIRPIAPIYVRADHRIVDAHQIGAFAETLRQLLGDPAKLD